MELSIIYGSIFSPLVPLLTYLLVRKLDLYGYIILTLVVFSFSIDVLTSFVIAGNNYYILHFYFFGLSNFLFYFFYLALPDAKTYIIFTAITFNIYYVYNSIIGASNRSFKALELSILSLIMISLSIYFLYKTYQSELDIFIERIPIFWFNIAVLTYFSGALFSFLLSQEILNGPMPWAFHNIANILKNILFAVGLWKTKAVI